MSQERNRIHHYQRILFELIRCRLQSQGDDMRRRHFLGVLGGAALWPFAARSQGTAAPVIGFLSPSSNSADYVEGFVAGLRELGYVDGRNIRIEFRWADGKLDQLPRLAAKQLRLNVDVLVTSVTEASLQAKKATATTPIVMAAVGDPVAAGLCRLSRSSRRQCHRHVQLVDRCRWQAD